MAKRKDKDGESSGDENMDMLDVDFEFFDPQPDVDFLGIKCLIRQLLDVDAQLVELTPLVDLILAQPLLGSTVKVDGNETDPYAFLTILNLHEHRNEAVVKSLTKYIEQQAAKNIALAPISILFDPPNTAQIGLVLTERLVNIPSEVVPPMYKMLLEEMTWAVEEKEPYTFSHYLILSKTYLEVASTLDVEEGPQPEKKKKKGKSGKGVSAKNSGGEVFYFHPEDEVLHRHAIAFGDYAYDNEHKDGQSDAKRTFQEFGIKPQGHMILIEAAKFEGAVKALEDFIRPP